MTIVRIKHSLRGPYWIGETLIESPPPAGYLHNSPPPPNISPPTHAILGILDLTNRTRYGFSSRGVPQYLFHPYNERLPPMIVGSRAPTTTNQWAAVRWSGWDTVRDRWPRANLETLLGPVGDLAVECGALRRAVTAVGKSDKDSGFQTLPSSAPPYEEWSIVFNVDPAGCRDVDDVIAWRQMDGGETEFAIAIADVASAVPAGSPQDCVAAARAQTVYEDGAVLQPMLPAAISEAAASLLADGTPRSVVALVWTIDNDKHVLSGPEWRHMCIQNRQTFTYDGFATSELAGPCKTFLEAVSATSDATVLRAPLSDDTHTWIERAMILYNYAAARRVREVGAGVLRVHSAADKCGDLAAIAAATGHPEIATLGFAAGEYISVGQTRPTSHAGLALPIYCHASSPLRRYADLVNQRVLLGMLSRCESVSTLNERAREIKVFERTMWCLKHLSPRGTSLSEGIVVEMKGSEEATTERCLKVWVPAWKRTVKSRFFTMSGEPNRVQPKDSSEPWVVHVGQRVRVEAYWDLRSGRTEERFVFRVSECEA